MARSCGLCMPRTHCAHTFLQQVCAIVRYAVPHRHACGGTAKLEAAMHDFGWPARWPPLARMTRGGCTCVCCHAPAPCTPRISMPRRPSSPCLRHPRLARICPVARPAFCLTRCHSRHSQAVGVQRPIPRHRCPGPWRNPHWLARPRSFGRVHQ